MYCDPRWLKRSMDAGEVLADSLKLARRLIDADVLHDSRSALLRRSSSALVLGLTPRNRLPTQSLMLMYEVDSEGTC